MTKPYKPVSMANRCPHGYDKFECVTCVDAKAYWDKLPAPLHPSSAIGNGYTTEQLRSYGQAEYERAIEDAAKVCDGTITIGATTFACHSVYPEAVRKLKGQHE